MPTIVFRIVQTLIPTDADYLTYAELGRVKDDADPETIRRGHGLSVFESLEASRKAGSGPPWFGSGYIATYAIPENEEFQLEQTGKRRTHYTLWCDRAKMRTWLQTVAPILEDEVNVP